ncbi:MAG: sulfur carrier protein ThiS adenylyltransferase ThiF [Fibrobacterota bacterium]
MIETNTLTDYFTSLYGEENYGKIRNTHIGIGGAGGLGSNCAFNLVRAGFRKFTLYDFDFVELSNLNRQFYFADQIGLPKVNALITNLKRITPDLSIRAEQLRLTPQNISEKFADASVLVEAFDTVDAKRMMAEEFMQKTPLLVSASGLAGWGHLEDITIRRVNDSFILIGDGTRGASAERPPISPRVNAVAAMQADIILEHVLQQTETNY